MSTIAPSGLRRHELLTTILEPGACFLGAHKSLPYFWLRLPGMPDRKVPRVNVAWVRDRVPMVFTVDEDKVARWTATINVRRDGL